MEELITVYVSTVYDQDYGESLQGLFRTKDEAIDDFILSFCRDKPHTITEDEDGDVEIEVTGTVYSGRIVGYNI